MSNPTKRKRVEKIVEKIPVGTLFTSQDISDSMSGSKALTITEVAVILPGCKNVQNLTNRHYGMDTYMRI